MNTTLKTQPATFEDIDPATGEVIATVEITSAAEIEATVARAQAAWSGWAATPLEQRLEMLRKGCAAMYAMRDEMAQMIVREMGKVLPDAEGEIEGWWGSLDGTFAEYSEAFAPEVTAFKRHRTTRYRDAHGVVAAVAPWNFPMRMPIGIVMPALAAGNAVVLKPTEHAPMVGAMIVEAFAPHLPKDVIQLVQGEGATGAALVASDVDMVGFVGSRATGSAIMSASAPTLKRMVLELGGKDPLIVLADADLDAAAKCAVTHALRNTGQVCCSVERVYVADSIADAFEAKVVELAAKWTHGSGFEAGVRMGPMVSKGQRAKCHAQVEDAVAKGARLLMGGTIPDGDGAFYPATVVADIPANSTLLTEETFGPVVCLYRYDGSEQESVRLGNDSIYGLAANVYSADEAKAARIAKQLRFGQIGINRYISSAPGSPWVGARQSGHGYLGGIEGHRQFSSPKSVTDSNPDA
jgi:succinate-semialdehyde dehydrogenase/glutarate-semialdehyde dehydrogenase